MPGLEDDVWALRMRVEALEERLAAMLPKVSALTTPPKPEREVVGWVVRDRVGGRRWVACPGAFGCMTITREKAHVFATKEEARDEAASFCAPARVYRRTRPVRP
jgi:hypothetical protein